MRAEYNKNNYKEGNDHVEYLNRNSFNQGDTPSTLARFWTRRNPTRKARETGVAGNDPEEWKRTVLATKEGQLYLEPTYIFGCLRDGARHVKKGRGSIQSLVTATLQIVDDRILVDRFLPEPLTRDTEQSVYLDVRSVKNPATKGRNVRYRVAAGTGWALAATIEWDKTIVSRGEMEAVCIDAGRLS